jgi:iron complex transport system substrate-binding protein
MIFMRGGDQIPVMMVWVGWLAVFVFLNFLTDAAFGASMTVRDALGRNIEVRLPIQRIVALNSDVLEVLRTLKAEDRVAGVFSEIVREGEFWDGLALRPKVGSWFDPDMEAIAALKPDLVIAYSRNPGPLLEKKMALFGIQVLRIDLYKIDTLGREVQVLGQLLRKEVEARRFCDWHRRYVEMIRTKIGGALSRPAVYIESYTDYHAAGPGSGGHEMCVLAGGRNIAAGLSIPYPRVTPEWVVSENPEVIVKAAAYGNGYALKDGAPFNRRRDAILRRKAWRHIAAVASGNVHVMDSAIWTGPRAIIGIAYMVRWIHPVLFFDLNPGVLHREYLETFQGVPYRGAFVSDSLAGARK